MTETTNFGEKLLLATPSKKDRVALPRPRGRRIGLEKEDVENCKSVWQGVY